MICLPRARECERMAAGTSRPGSSRRTSLRATISARIDAVNVFVIDPISNTLARIHADRHIPPAAGGVEQADDDSLAVLARIGEGLDASRQQRFDRRIGREGGLLNCEEEREGKNHMHGPNLVSSGPRARSQARHHAAGLLPGAVHPGPHRRRHRRHRRAALAIAFAIASGLPPERGLYTAIVAGFLISLLGGSRVQIGGPTGAFVVIVSGIVQQHGVDGLVVATLMAGFILVAFGLLRFGAAIKFIPYPVTIGFTSGIALIIFSSQIRDLPRPRDAVSPRGVPAQMGRVRARVRHSESLGAGRRGRDARDHHRVAEDFDAHSGSLRRR